MDMCCAYRPCKPVPSDVCLDVLDFDGTCARMTVCSIAALTEYISILSHEFLLGSLMYRGGKLTMQINSYDVVWQARGPSKSFY